MGPLNRSGTKAALVPPFRSQFDPGLVHSAALLNH